MYAFLKLLLFELYINLLSSLSIFNETFGLFISKSVGLVLVKLYLFAYASSFVAFFFCDKGYHSNAVILA